jgi:hypothetical protein
LTFPEKDDLGEECRFCRCSAYRRGLCRSCLSEVYGEDSRSAERRYVTGRHLGEPSPLDSYARMMCGITRSGPAL